APRTCFLLLSLSLLRPSPSSTLFPYTTLFRSSFSTRPWRTWTCTAPSTPASAAWTASTTSPVPAPWPGLSGGCTPSSCRGVCSRSEEHTSELQSRFDLVCRLLLEKKKHTLTHI